MLLSYRGHYAARSLIIPLDSRMLSGFGQDFERQSSHRGNINLTIFSSFPTCWNGAAAAETVARVTAFSFLLHSLITSVDVTRCQIPFSPSPHLFESSTPPGYNVPSPTASHDFPIFLC